MKNFKTLGIQQRHYSFLDIGRFVAAFAVLFYHFTFEGWTEKSWYLSFSFGDFWKYGYLGVQFFFIISGFVVFMSAKKKSLISFTASRIARLYPAYWTCVILTFFTLLIISDVKIPLSNLAINLTMLQGFFKVPHIDSVYWSLMYELIFYFWIGCFLLFKCSDKKLSFFLLFFLSLSTASYFFKIPNFIVVIFQTVYAPYFIAGICLYRMTEGSNRINILLLTWCFLLSLAQVKYQLIELSTFKSMSYSLAMPYTILFAIYAFFILLVSGVLALNIPWSASIGALSYPIYLIHMEVGVAIFEKFGANSNKYFLLLFLILFFIIVSFLINKYIESIFGNRLKSFITNCLHAISTLKANYRK